MSDSRRETAPVVERVPLFPLPGAHLFPGSILPLHVFEPRYCQMVEDLLDRRGRLVLGTVLEGHRQELDSSPPVHGVAGMGEISRHRRLDDGRFMIWLVGLGRVRIVERPSQSAYRLVDAEWLEELPVEEDREDHLRALIADAIGQRAQEAPALDHELSLGQLTDVLLQIIPLPATTMQRLFAELSVSRRAELTIEEHLRRS